MANRTTDAAVRALLLSDVDSTVSDLTSWIDFANTLTTRVCSVEPTYTADDLEKIERCLAAHFYSISDPRTKSEGVSGINASYEGQTGFFLNATRFGQMAMVIDTEGYLSTMSALMQKGKRRRKLGVLWLGTPKNQTADTGYMPFPSSELDQVDGGTGDYLNP